MGPPCKGKWLGVSKLGNFHSRPYYLQHNSVGYVHVHKAIAASFIAIYCTLYYQSYICNEYQAKSQTNIFLLWIVPQRKWIFSKCRLFKLIVC